MPFLDRAVSSNNLGEAAREFGSFFGCDARSEKDALPSYSYAKIPLPEDEHKEGSRNQANFSSLTKYRRKSLVMFWSVCLTALCMLSIIAGSGKFFRKQPEPIPNIAHFVHLVRPGAPLRFNIQEFLAYYSAYTFMKPDSMNIYTNVNDTALLEAKNSDAFTQSVFNIPKLKFRQVKITGRSPSGKRLTGGLAHESDFIRAKLLKESGGIYLDEDTYLVRPIDDLRYSGFQNILGRQFQGSIGSAMILATPNSRLMSAFQQLQDRVYNGRWVDHTNGLLTDLVRTYQNIHKEVIIMEYNAFFPFGWDKWGLEMLYKIHPHETSLPSISADSPSWNDTEYYENYSLTRAKQVSKTYPWNWSQSWAIHGWHNAHRSLKPGERTSIFGEYKSISLDYLLANNSNFARGVYPALRSAIDSGILLVPSK